MNITQSSKETGIFSEHFNLLRAQFSNHLPITHFYHQQLILGDLTNSTNLMHKAIRSQFLLGKYAECLKFIDGIPLEYLEHMPVMFVYRSIAMLFCNFPNEQIHLTLSKAEELDNVDRIQGEIITAKALIQSYSGDQDQGIQLSLKALSKIDQENTFFRNMIERNLGLAFTLKGDLRKAAMWYEKVLLSSHKLKDHGGILSAYNYLTYIRKAQGRLKDAGVIYKKALHFIEENQLENFPHSIKIVAGYGHLLIQWHRIEDAKIYLRKAIQGAKNSDILLAQKAYQDLSEVYIREHDFCSALTNIQECRQLIQNKNSNYANLLSQLLLATEARIHLEAGRIDQANTWLSSSGFSQIIPQDLYSKLGDQLGYVLPIAVRIYLAKDMNDKALEVLHATIPKFLHVGANAYLIRALSALAITYNHLGETAKAVKALIKAIDLGKPENNFGDFIIIGQDLMPLLYEIIQSGIETEYCGKLLALFSNYSDLRSSATELINNVGPLSKRELDVLQLIAEGMTNREIASALFVSANTIKSHSIKIYKKLNVNNRNQAVSKAQLLGILPSKLSSRYQASA